ncbi:hypothetical protein FB45DRAFT_1043141 [Roridomyces roridus]|uniref:Uncharacterized protein n=1 Tax=Roridomyces roridus TaxID=1738132 RepID=A0AAD7AYU8_9AGAR|nr:hypothetical protein FB45DRAFT_1043141 [Roridomyces roridus]
MPYSLSALFALPRSFAGLFFARKAFHLSKPSPPVVKYTPPVVKYTPTRTTSIFLEPTRCLPSPTSSEPSELPYVVMCALAIVVIASVVFTIWSTFKDARCSPTPTAAIPPEPDTEPDISPRDYTQIMTFLFAFFMTLCAYVSASSTPKTPDSLFFGMTIHGLVQTAEDQIQSGLGVIQHLHDHGLHYLKITLLAIVGHSLGLLIVQTHRRALSFAHRILVRICHSWQRLSPALVPLVLSIFHPQLNWALWMHHYFACRGGYIPDMQQIRQSFVLSLPWMSWNATLMVIGPVIIYSIAIGLLTGLLVLRSLPAATQVTIRELYRADAYSLLFFAVASVVITHYCVSVLQFIVHEVMPMGADVQEWIVIRLKKAFSSSKARAEVWEFYAPSRERHRSWRITQSEEVVKIMRLLWTTAWSSWEALPWAQKLLVVAPAAVFCVHFYIMPLVDRIELLIRIEYWKYRRRRAVRQFHLKNYSVENRLAANN